MAHAGIGGGVNIARGECYRATGGRGGGRARGDSSCDQEWATALGCVRAGAARAAGVGVGAFGDVASIP
jgi:hypothetical protein